MDGAIREGKSEDASSHALQMVDAHLERTDIDEDYLRHGREEADEVDARADVYVALRRKLGNPPCRPDVLEEVVLVVRRCPGPIVQLRVQVAERSTVCAREAAVAAQLAQKTNVPGEARNDAPRLETRLKESLGARLAQDD